MRSLEVTLKRVSSLLLISLCVACGSDAHSSTGVPPIEGCMLGLRASPPSASLRLGDSLQAEALYGCATQHANVRWRSSDTSVATVDATGMIRARSRPGAASIVALLVADTFVIGAMALQTTR